MERLGGMACTHPAAARPRAGSGEASIGSKERSSKRDAGLGAWRLSLSGEAACVKTVAIFDGGSRSCDSTALRAATRKRIFARRICAGSCAGFCDSRRGSLKTPVCGGVPSSHPSSGVSVFFLYVGATSPGQGVPKVEPEH